MFYACVQRFDGMDEKFLARIWYQHQHQHKTELQLINKKHLTNVFPINKQEASRS